MADGTEPKLEIAEATVEDVPIILELICALADYEKLRDCVVVSEELLREHLFGPHPAAEVLLARKDGGVVGFALFFATYSTFLGRPGIYLEDLFVRPEARKAGVGIALLKALAGVAFERGCGRLEWSVLDWNKPAIEFYERLGARPVDGWTRYRLTGESIAALAES